MAVLTTLFSFDGTNAATPYAGLIADAAGDLFGTTFYSGTGGAGTGTVFELVNNGGGNYTPITLVSFDGTNGANPYAGLIADAAGDLFGTTAGGGANGNGGTVFEFVNHGGGNYTQTTLVTFNGTNGSTPYSSLIADAAGALFGTTYGGGANGVGTVFELVNHGGGNYTPTTLVSFTNGARPISGLIADAAGDLFGTTTGDGANGVGTVFELVNHGGGNYTPTTLVTFNGTNGAYPAGGLIADAAGDLFGTTLNGGANGLGTVFELVNNGGGNYTPITLVSFDGTNGALPQSSLIADAAGDLFGTTYAGGAGTVFELVNHGGGNYTQTTLVTFNGTNGASPYASLIADAAGDLFGTTTTGGANDAGTVFEITNTGFFVSLAPTAGQTYIAGTPGQPLTSGQGSVFLDGSQLQNQTISAGNAMDTVIAGSNDTIKLGMGNDVVQAGANSTITLGNGNDTVTAGANSTITLGNGNDIIHVGTNDTVTVGKGHDSFVFDQTVAGSIGAVTINHFDPSKDVIQISSALATIVTPHNDSHGNAVITVDGSGDTITLVGVHSSALHASDFHFV